MSCFFLMIFAGPRVQKNLKEDLILAPEKYNL